MANTSDSTRRCSHLVITVHGIRTFGDWQTRLRSLLLRGDGTPPDMDVVAYRYGYFSVIAFMVPFLRWLVVRTFRKALIHYISDHGHPARIDLVAHSFGTHLVAWALIGIPKATRPTVHTIILAGSVLKVGFSWRLLMADDKVHRVINECGIHDSVLVLNQLLVLFTGMAGRVGFNGMEDGERFVNRYYRFGHSGYFQGTHLADQNDFMREKWLPLLLSNSTPSAFDERARPTALQGLTIVLLNNAEPIKVCAYAAPFLSLGVIYYWLWHNEKTAHTQALSAMRTENAVSYRQRVLLAHREYLANHVAHAESILAQCIPHDGFDDLRHWEWYHLRALCASKATVLQQGSPIAAIAWHPQEDIVASVGRNGVLQIWNAVDPALVAETHLGSAGDVTVAWKPDGSQLAICLADGTVAFWDHAHQTLRPLPRVATRIAALAWISTGQIVTAEYGPNDGYFRWSLRLRDGKSGTEIATVLDRTHRVSALASHHSGLVAAAIDAYHFDWRTNSPPRVVVFDMRRPWRASTSIECGSPVTSLSWRADGRGLVLGGEDGRVLNCRVRKSPNELTGLAVAGSAAFPLSLLLSAAHYFYGEPVVDAPSDTLTVHDAAVTAVACSPQLERIASGCIDWSVRVSSQGQKPITLRGHGGPVRTIAWGPSGRIVASGGDDGKLMFWNWGTIEENPKRLADWALDDPGEWPIYSCSLSPDGTALAMVVGAYERNHRFPVTALRIVDALTGKDIDYEESIGASGEFTWSSDGKAFVLYGGNEPYIFIHPYGRGGREQRELTSLLDVATVASWRPHSQQLFCGGKRGQLVEFDAEMGDELGRIVVPGGDITCVKWHRAGTLLSWGGDGIVGALNCETRRVRQWWLERGTVMALAWSPDGKWLASGGEGRVIHLYEISSDRVLELEGHAAEVLSLDWSPDGARLASAGGDRTVRVWDAETGKELLSFGGQKWGRMKDVAWSPDGFRLYALDLDVKHVLLWDAIPSGVQGSPRRDR
jgi:WD40 repeat protein